MSEASDGDAAVLAVSEHGPDVILMDVRMPGKDGSKPRGAQGYLLKEAEQDDIVRAVRGVVAGEAIFGPGVATRVLAYFSDPPPAVTRLALIGHGWWVLETGADEDREAMLWLALAALTIGSIFSLLVLR